MRGERQEAVAALPEALPLPQVRYSEIPYFAYVL